mgnify:CR=1 FL=1|tara:strand:+ start:490 stop:1230 length:741 start_codon:yes stop_codon:yes gene_type:complete
MNKVIILLLLALILTFFTIYLVFRNRAIYDSNSTAIIINYARPHNITKLIPELKKSDVIKEIIVLHCNPKTYSEFKGVINLKNFQDKYGGAERFFVVNHAKYNNILFLDDDIVPSNNLIKTLQNELLKDRYNIYGPLKRLCHRTGYYADKNVNDKNYNIILTPIMMTSKELVQNYIKYFELYDTFLMKTHGNCEDLSINHFLKYEYSKKPKYIKGDYYYLDNKSEAYSSKPKHKKQRDEFCIRYFK